MKSYFILTILVLTTFIGAAQSSITGKIFDKETNEPLIGASVLIKETLTGATTDFDGNFIIENVGKGTFNLSCTYIG